MFTKICTICTIPKDIKEFHKNPHGSFGVDYRCKQCRKDFHKKHPWKQILRNIRFRCENPKSVDYKWYSSKRIKNYLTEEDIRFLMGRDNYYKLNNPTIDRIDNDGNYTLKNCRFIENEENSAKDKRCKVLQFTKNNEFIKEWSSLTEVKNNLNIDHSNIISAINGKYKHAGGYKWKYKN